MRKKTISKNTSSLQKTLSESGLKMTPQRTAIYELIKNSSEHPTADRIYKMIRKQLPNISFDTVYRTLMKFSEVGLLKVTERYGDNKRFDPRLDQHHHCHCIKCQKIIDFCHEEYDLIKIPKILDEQFKVINKRVVLDGICAECKGS